MAFSTKISFVPRDNGEKSVSFDNVNYDLPIPLYNTTKLDIDFPFLNFRNIYSNGYLDYVAVLTLEEFLILHNSNYIPNIPSTGDVKLIEFLSTTIYNTKYNWVLINIYEWESGL